MIARRTPDFTLLFESILRCRAVYISDAAERARQFSALGSAVIAQLETDHNQAVLHRTKAGRLMLTIAGTRFSEGALPERVGDLLADWKDEPLDIGGGVMVASKPYQYSDELYAWLGEQVKALNLVKDEGGEVVLPEIDFEGHSKGAWQATYALIRVGAAPMWLVGHIVAWESPHQGNDAFWRQIVDDGLIDRITQIYHRLDPWALWDWEIAELNKGPAPVLWLNPQAQYDGHHAGWIWALPQDIPVAEFSNFYQLLHEEDHGPDSVVDFVGALATRQAQQQQKLKEAA